MEQDVRVPRNDRSIRNIPVPASHRHAQPVQREPLDDLPQPPKRKGMKGFWWWLSGIVVVAIIAGLLISTMFQGATVTVHPKTAAVTLPSTISAVQNAAAGALGYQTVSFTESASTTAATSGTQNVSKSATGQITIYNNYSSASQTLVATTRFATSDGKIYRIHQSVVVPGQTTSADGTQTPGSVTATVYADKPGDAYNQTAAVQFTIPGFSGDPRFNKFYAQSNGPIVGGFVGQQPAPSAADLTAAQNTLKQQLDAAARAAIAKNVPSGFIQIGGTFSISYDDVQQTPGQGSNVILSQSAVANAAIVRSSDLATAVASAALPNYDNSPVDFTDPSQVTATLGGNSAAATSGTITIALSGSPTLVWQFDQNALKQQLLGSSKSSFETVIQSFPAIDTAAASVIPFWKSTFPSDPSKLSIKVGQ